MFYGPIPDAEMAHLSAWRPIIRAPVTTAEQAVAVLEQAIPAGCRVILLVETINDALVEALAPLADQAAAVELGNELNFYDTAEDFGAFVVRGRNTLRAAGFTGEIISGAVGNIDPDTLRWLERAGVADWPNDIVLGWHGYSDWKDQVPALVALAHGRPHAMTEWGYSHPTPEDEARIAAWTTVDLTLLYQSGTRYAIWYQIHDGTEPSNQYGLVTLDGRWRQTEQSLRAATPILQ
jgi:hypothetical protein